MSALLKISYLGGSGARADYFLDGVSDCFCDAFVGRCGLGKEREGDAKSPVGEFGVRRAFGIKADPGTSFDYLRVRPGVVACDEKGPYYNQIVCDVECGGEKMWELSPEYDYGLELDFNPENIYPLGSAIFVHCKGRKTWTGGCVALDEPMLVRILQTAGPDLRVVIG